MSVASLVQALEARIKEIETALQQNSVKLSGHLEEAKYLLDLATKVAGILPANPVTEALDAVDTVVDTVESAPAASEETAAPVA